MNMAEEIVVIDTSVRSFSPKDTALYPRRLEVQQRGEDVR